jgi:hypothetical protein
MATAYFHALSSVRKWGGEVNDFLPVHDWLDESKGFMPDFRHRALRHHSEGILLCERIFGATVTTSKGRVIPVRWIAEAHVKEDLGRIPTVSDWLRCLRPEAWMTNSSRRKLEEELAGWQSTRSFVERPPSANASA